MRLILSLLLIICAQMAAAHPGHLVDVAGHDHWVAGAAIGAAVLIGLWGVLKGKKETDGESDPEDPLELEEEAA